ncbi:MAG: hypothetical protein K2Y42_06695 [Hyphomicrobium sp.]|uniref:hypothetical protein n=1 Tax=Hyphomicrobium sp. TaxID=82 RepID=UPI0025C55586|nr:hypothetical protein [Hyphomicrobium sp.]MBX9862426.1 hypothetical protein [Hyphomicrobium sp.]
MDQQSLLEMKQSALQSIATLEKLSVGASPEEMSIIDKMLTVSRNNFEIAEIALSCHQMVGNTLANVA